MNDIDKIKAKIKKLLALSRSPNPNEAASALKMAQALMVEYNVSTAAVNNFDVVENSISVPCRKIPPVYETMLLRKISEAFGCYHFYSHSWDGTEYVFIGLKHHAEIASFLGEVLLRKVRSARSGYLKTLKRVRLKKQKTKRADDFCFYWAFAVTEKLPEFAGVSDSEKKEIELFVQHNHSGLYDLKPRSRRGNADDRLKGYAAGEVVQLQHGVGVHSKGSLLLEA